VRIEAERELLAPAEDVWKLLAEPRHLSDWWPGYGSIRPDRRGLAPNARWQVVRSPQAGLLRKPGGEGLIVLKRVEDGRALGWHDVQQQFDATIEIAGADSRTNALVTLESPWWRIRLEGLRRAPAEALARLHALCQTAAGL
jgi:polyketide cyclase/dehydrase/lipid transport protein